MKPQIIIPFDFLSLNDEGYHLKVDAVLNGVGVKLILDTGASQSAFDINFVREIIHHDHILKADQISSGLGTNTMESFECIFETFSIGSVRIENYKAAVLDLSHVNHTYTKLGIPKIQGVLGNDILRKYTALIDYSNQHLVFS